MCMGENDTDVSHMLLPCNGVYTNKMQDLITQGNSHSGTFHNVSECSN